MILNQNKNPLKAIIPKDVELGDIVVEQGERVVGSRCKETESILLKKWGLLRMDRKKILMIGAFSRPNFGDVLLGRLFHDLFVEKGYDVYFAFNSNAVIKECDYKKANFSTFLKVDYAFYVGGGYLSEPPGNVTRWAISRYVKLFFIGDLLKLLFKKYSIIGVGAGPINGFFSKFLIKRLVAKAEHVIVRDSLSKATLNNLIINKDIDVGADLVLNLNQLLYIQKKEIPQKKIGLHLSPNRDDINIIILNFFKDEDAWIIEDHSGTLSSLIKKYPIISEKYLNRLIDYKGHEDFIDVINDFEFVLTSKLHVGIVSAVLGKRICSLPYHKKVLRFYEDIGRADLCLDGNGYGNDKLLIHIEYCLSADSVTLDAFDPERKTKLFDFVNNFEI